MRQVKQEVMSVPSVKLGTLDSVSGKSLAPEVNERLRDLLRELIKTRSQTELVSLLGVTQSALSGFVSGRQGTSFTTGIRIAELAGKDPLEILGIRSSPHPHPVSTPKARAKERETGISPSSVSELDVVLSYHSNVGRWSDPVRVAAVAMAPSLPRQLSQTEWEEYLDRQEADYQTRFGPPPVEEPAETKSVDRTKKDLLRSMHEGRDEQSKTKRMG